MANDHNVRVKAYVDPKVGDKFQVHIDSWADSIFYRSVFFVNLTAAISPVISWHKTDKKHSAGVSLLDLCACDRDIQAGTWSAIPVTNPQPLQEFSGHVTFKRRYPAPPTVICWLTGFDFGKGRNFRIRTEVSNITATGFSIKVATWADSLLYWASASWIAYPSDSPTVKSGSYNTMDVRPWQNPQLEDSGSVKFSGQPFAWAPTLLLGVNTFDIDGTKGTSIRWKATASDVSRSGYTWHLDSWFDTVKYSMGCSYLALDNGPK